MQNIPSPVRSVWTRYRGVSAWLQAMIAIVLIVGLLFIVNAVAHKGGDLPVEASLPTVTLATVSSLGGNSSSVAIVGSVRSITEAEVLSQSGGTVTALHGTQGKYVPTGFIISELENASQRAAVLQAEGSYESALAAHAGVSTSDIASSARNTYATAFSTLDTLLTSDVDILFGEEGGQGRQFLISPAPFNFAYFPTHRQVLADAMSTWRSHMATASGTNPQTLLDEADKVVHQATALGNDLAQAATKNGTDASATQLTALAAARTGFAALQASITAAKAAYQGQSTSATRGADASVKIALGGLRAAQALLEKTLVRAPISGTINFLPIHLGDYVAPLTHVATVAQNGTLEILANISEDTRALLLVGDKVTVEDSYPAVITSIAPALDPVTKQIEIHIVLAGKSPFLNGQSVRIALPSSAPVKTAGTQLLPLTALKLTPSARVVFSVGEDGRLVAHPVTIGDVQGDRIEVTTPLPGDLEIVTDVRGFSEGEKVTLGNPH